MDPKRFDQFSKAIATRSSRRSALSRLGLGGLLGAAAGGGVAREAFAANGDESCVLQFHAKTAVGSHKNTVYEGALTLIIGSDGAIDDGSYDDGSGDQPTVAGHASGRALSFRFDYSSGDHFSFEGTAAQDLVLCRGDIEGTFGGPAESDLGTWRATTGAGTSGGSTSGGNSSSGNSSGGSSGGSSSGGGGSSCASGVVCGGTCCVARDGFTPDSISCDGDFCSCSYSCASGGCPGGDPSAVIKIGCEDRPNALCGEFCNVVPPDDTPTGGNGANGAGGCPSDLQFCDGSTPCCTAFAPYEATDISCLGGTCRCMYSCAQAGCTSTSTTTFMTIACTQNPNDLCPTMGCNV